MKHTRGPVRATLLAGALLVILAGLVAACGGSDTPGPTAAVPYVAQTGGSAEFVVKHTGEVKTFDIEIGEFYVKPSKIEINAGDSVILNVTNKGNMRHDLKLDGVTGTGFIEPGRTESTELGDISGPSEAWCTISGHKAAGMLLAIEVTGATTTHTTVSTNTSKVVDDSAVIDPNAKPGIDWKPFDPKLAPAPGGTEHKITIEAGETLIEVAPGVTQEMWTFNGQFPGPTLRGKVGDLFTITLVNKGKVAHSIDLHASKVAWNDEMRSINPGESLVYQFQAKFTGIFMYHCGTAPALHHIGNGMFGTIIIDPPSLPTVDHEFIIIQSELYLGPQGQPGDLTKMTNEDWDAVVFNGYFNQYLHKPIRVEPGQRVRVWVIDEGPSENSSFHIVGTVFDTVYKEGTYLLRPNDTRGGAQALDLQPAQGGFVEFT